MSDFANKHFNDKETRCGICRHYKGAPDVCKACTHLRDLLGPEEFKHLLLLMRSIAHESSRTKRC
jgi:hypothetical protein